MIPYGGVPVTAAPEEPVRKLGLEPGRYLVSIARVEPDNSIATLVEVLLGQAARHEARGARQIRGGERLPPRREGRGGNRRW